jgi:transcriptional regulator with XRE-family HTH domain
MKRAMQIKGLADFLRTKMNEYHMSAREFAAHCNVSPQLINNILNEKPDYVPSVETFVQLAKALKVSPLTLFALVLPTDTLNSPKASTLLLSEKIESLSPHERDVFDTVLMGLLARRGQETS